MSRPARTISLGLLLVAVAIAVRVGHGSDGRAHVQMTSKASAARLARAPSSPATAGASPRQRMSAADVQRAFVRSYLSYLSGSLPASRLRYASITARDQASAGGRIPPRLPARPPPRRARPGGGAALAPGQGP